MEPTTILIVVSAALSVASAIYSASLVGNMDQDDPGTTVTKTGTTSTKNPVYGKCRVGSVNVYNNVVDSSNQFLVSAFSLGIGPMEAIHQVYIDDIPTIPESSYATDPNGDNQQLIFDGVGDFANQNVKVQVRSGLNTEIPLGLVMDNSDNEWTASHRGDRCAQVGVRVTRVIDNEGARILSPQFSMSALVSGLKVYDPRIHNDPSQKSFSRNTALCILDYITDSYYGMGIAYKYIDLQSFIDCANWIDIHELYIDAEIDSSLAFSEILGKMVACFGGIIIAEDGYIKLLYDDIALPKYHFNEDNIVSSGIRVTNQNSSGYYNVVETSYKNYQMDEKEDMFTLPKTIASDPRIASDGYVKSTKLELPYTIDGRQEDGIPDKAVKFLTNRVYNRSNFQKRVDFDVDMLEFPVNIYDVIEITNEHYGWDRKKWRVTSKNKAIDEDKLNIATLSCEEYDDSIYLGDQDGGGGKPLPPPKPLTPPTALKFNLMSYITTGYGELTWANTSFGASNETEVEYKLSSQSGWTRVGRTGDTIWKFFNLAADTYDFRVRTFNPVRGTSSWTELTNIVIAPNVVLPSVTGVDVAVAGADFSVTWNDMLNVAVPSTPSGPDNGGSDGTVGTWFSHYSVDIFHFVNNSYQFVGNYITADPSLLYTFDENAKNGLNRRVQAEVYVVSKDGTSSQSGSGSVDYAINPQHGAISGISVDTSISTTVITWDAPDEVDYRATRIYSSTTQGFTPAPSNLMKETIGTLFTHLWSDTTTRYIRMAHVDVFGNDNQSYTSEISITPTSFDDLLPEFPTELSAIRDPKRAQNKDGELVFSTASPNERYVAGMGIYAQGPTRFIVAADEFVVAAGGAAYYNPRFGYSVGDRVSVYIDDRTEQLYEAKTSVPLDTPPPNTTYWELKLDNTFQSVLYVDTLDERLYIRNATIKDLDAGKITTGYLAADRIEVGTLNGNKFSATSTITAGTGGNTAGMNGDDTTGDPNTPNNLNTRFWAGNQYAIVDPSSPVGDFDRYAPFVVTSGGNVYMSKANVRGDINATSGHFSGNITVGTTVDSNNYLQLRGANATGSDQTGIRVVNGGIQTFALRMNGAIEMRDASNEIVLDIDPIGGRAVFSGNVYANSIIGDTITKVARTAPAIPDTDLFNGSTHEITLASFTINSHVPYDRFVDYPITRNVQVITGSVNYYNGNYQVVVRNITDGNEWTIHSGSIRLSGGTNNTESISRSCFNGRIPQLGTVDNPASGLPAFYNQRPTSYAILFRLQSESSPVQGVMSAIEQDTNVSLYRNTGELS